MIRDCLLRLLWILATLLLFFGVLGELARGQNFTTCPTCPAGSRGCGRVLPAFQNWNQAATQPARAATPQTPRPSQPTQRNPSPCEVRIIGHCAGGAIAYGSGTLVARESGRKTAVVLTVAHVIEGAQSIAIQLPNGQSYQAAVIGVDATLDVATLRIADPGVGIATIATDSPQPGATVSNGGWTADGRFHSGTGRMNAKAMPAGSNEATWMETSCSSAGGMSGGGVYDASGRIVGVISAGDGSTTAGACLPAIRDALAKLLPPYAGSNADATSIEQLPSMPAPAAAASQAAAIAANPMVPPMVPPAPAYDDHPLKEAIEKLRGDVAERAKEGPILAKIEELRQSIPTQAGQIADLKLQPLAKTAEDLAILIGRHDTQLKGLPAVLDRLKTAEGRLDAVPGADKICEAARNVAISVVSEQGPTLVAAAEPLLKTGLTAGLTALGISSPIAAVGAWLALALAKRGAKKIGDQIAAKGTTNQIPAASLPPEYRTQSAAANSAVIVRQDSPPPPQKVVSQSTYVPYQTRTVEQDAMEWALDNHVRSNPGAIGTINAIKSAAAQYVSGHPSSL